MDRYAQRYGLAIMVAAAVGCAAQGIAGFAEATPQPMTYHGNTILSGGVGEDEREAMRQEIAPFNLWLMFVDQGTGNYSAGVKVTLTDAHASPVVDAVSDGPWLLLHVPPGRYTVRTAGGREQPVVVGANGRTVAVLRLAAEPQSPP
jgi:hypothetical protein